MKTRTAAFALGVMPLMGTAGAPSSGGDAVKILERVAQTYAGCRTYQDKGVVRTVFVNGERRRTMELRFRTAFARPDRFRFEFSERTCCEDVGRYIIWQNGPEVLKWWELRRTVEKPESLGAGLGGAAGVSSSLSRTIPPLLLPDLRPGRLNRSQDPTLLTEAELDGVRCLRVQVQEGGHPLTAWIDSGSYLVRRLDFARETSKDSKVETTTLYEPTIDQEIAEEALAFGVPGKAGEASKASTRP
jgi:hypothetical protein